jgi:uncharacterized protein (TIGR02217 family)
MSITVLSNVIMPPLVIASGVRGKQIRRNSRVTTQGGHEYINIMWDQTLREFEIGLVPMRREAWQAIETLHEVTEGGAYGFLMFDPKDLSVTTSTGVVAGLGSNQFQLYKRSLHASSGRYKDRKITRPINSTFLVFVNGVQTAATLDDETGIVTIASNPNPATVTWSGRFYVPVHFMDDSIDWAMVVPHEDPDARFLAGPSTVLQEIRE